MSSRMWLWAAALLVLCVGLAAGPARAADLAWEAVAQDLPDNMVWDEQQDATVDVKNTGTLSWDTTFNLRSVDGEGVGAFPIDRWGIAEVPVVEAVASGEQLHLAFGVTAPPIATLRYVLPLTPTSVAVVTPFANNWMMAKDSSLIRTDTVIQGTVIDRFPDILPGTDGAWAATFIEELAGHVPFIARGFPDGSYKPRTEVTRDQMAVFMQRALYLPLLAPVIPPRFTDVAADFWAVEQIEALARSGIVEGFPGGKYRPGDVVSRAQMAVFVARGVAGGNDNVPSGPATATFPDVPTDFWAFKYIEFAVKEKIVEGFPGGNYKPDLAVARDQMAVFIYRGFIQPTGSIVVLAGPAVTRVDPAPPDPLFDGWSTISEARSSEPGNAYVGFDVVRMNQEMAPITVHFELRGDNGATVAASANVVIHDTDITNALALLGTRSGAPYIYAVWDIPTGLPAGDYILVVTVNGLPVEVLQPRAFSIL